MNRKHWILNLFILLFFFGIILSYILYYKSPAIRFAHRIFPLVHYSKEIQEYQKDGFTIRIINKDFITEIQFFSLEGLNQTFFVSQNGYEVSAFDMQHEKILSGIWRGGRLCSSNGEVLAEYQKTERRLYSENFLPDASDAIYIYKSYSTGTRGGKRAPKLVFIAVLLWLIFLEKLDAGSVWEQNLRYTLPMLHDYGKKEKSVQTMEGERFVFISLGILIIACVGILLYDIICY